jgi:Domain of unknown function (DUF4249)
MKLKSFHIIGSVAALFWIFLESCSPKPIPIYLDEVESLPVIWSQAIPNSTTLIYFSRSFSSLEFQENDSTSADSLISQFLVTDGLVTITHAGETDTLIQVSDGFFVGFGTDLIAGDDYTLNALDYLTGKSISAATKVYAAVPVDTVTYSLIDTSTVDLTVSFVDPPGANWYAIHYYSQYANPLELDDPFVADNVVETDVISDLELNSANVSINKTLEFIESDTLFVSLNNISQEYYDYLSQRERGGTIYNQLVQEPINYVSNIQNGFGMFSLHFPSVKTVILEE